MSERVAYTLGIGVVLGFIILLFALPAQSHDMDHPELNQWFSDLRQPDNPVMSCCGTADAYWCDDLSTETKVGDDGNTYTRNFCAITDEREVKGRVHVDVGTKIEIPSHKIKWTKNDPQSATDYERNPTSHSIVFLSRGFYVYCFIGGAGV